MPENRPVTLTSAQRVLIIAILLSAFTGIAISIMRSTGISGSALLYIGIPTFIALAFAHTSSSNTVMGSTLKAITFVILISGPILQEGFICMIMAAPILYIVGALVAWPFDHARKKKHNTTKLNVYVLPMLFIFMSMEGVIEETSFNRLNTIEHTQIINASVAEIKNRIGSNRPIQKPDNLFVSLFPQPDMINSEGVAIGDKHWVDISYLKWIYWNEKRGKVQFAVIENNPYNLKFKPLSDTSYLSSYLSWKNTDVTFQPVSENQTIVSWSISFQRDLDPAWYAQPLQQYVMGIVAKLMLESLQ